MVGYWLIGYPRGRLCRGIYPPPPHLSSGGHFGDRYACYWNAALYFNTCLFSQWLSAWHLIEEKELTNNNHLQPSSISTRRENINCKPLNLLYSYWPHPKAKVSEATWEFIVWQSRIKSHRQSVSRQCLHHVYVTQVIRKTVNIVTRQSIRLWLACAH